MSNLKIFSVSLEKNYVIYSRKREKRKLLKEIINVNNYDIVMMQGGNLRVNNKNHGYKELNERDNLVTLYKSSYPAFVIDDSCSDVVNGLVVYYKNRPLSIINVDCKRNNDKSFQKVLTMCEKYITLPYYVSSRVVSGVFPKDVDTNLFCEKFGLYEAVEPVDENEVNHFFISSNLECEHIIKEDGIIEASLSYKKVLK